MQHISTPAQQRGATTIGMLVIVAILGLGLYAVMRLTPVYIENYEIVRAMESVAKEHKGEDINPAEIRKALQRHWDIEDIKSLAVNDMDIKKIGSSYQMHAAYEARTPFVANVFWAIEFDNTVMMN